MYISNNKIQLFIMKQNTKTKVLARKSPVRNPHHLRFGSPKRSNKELNPFVYLSPKARVQDEVAYRNYLSLGTEKKIIRVTQQNNNLRVSLRQAKLGNKEINRQNCELRKKLYSFTTQIESLKRDIEDCKSVGTRDSIIFEESDSSPFVSVLRSAIETQNQYTRLKKQNSFLQSTLQDSNCKVKSLNSEIESKSLGVWLLSKRLDEKMKEIAKMKRQKAKQQLFQLTSQDEDQRV